MQEVQAEARVILALITLSPLLVGPAVLAQRHDPETGRIRLLFVGELHGMVNLFAEWYGLEPRMTVDVVPASTQDMTTQEAMRQARLYMPRNYDALTARYDCVLIQDMNPEVLAPNFIPDLRRSVLEEGLGSVLVEFVFWFGNGNRIDLWMASSFYEIIPADIVFGEEIPQGRDNFYELVSKTNRMLQLPGIESTPMNAGHHGTMIARPGSELLAKWRNTEYHCVTFNTPGKGGIVQVGHGWDNIPSLSATGWGYLQDYGYNLVFGTTGHEIPEDLELVRRARSVITSSEGVRSLVFSVMEFAELFGANTRPLAEEISRIDELRMEGNEAYIDGEYDEAASFYDRAIREYQEVQTQALAVKDRALLWVYVIEWLAVSGTSLVAGFVLYTLMIRRRMYKYVESTKTSSVRRRM